MNELQRNAADLAPEMTRDPIFILQRRRLMPDYEACCELRRSGVLWFDDDFEAIRQGPNYAADEPYCEADPNWTLGHERDWWKTLTRDESDALWDAPTIENDDLVNRLDAARYDYEPESVWFTRAEANEAAERRAYGYPDGWRVWCTCANGALAQILAEHTAPAPERDTGEA